MFPLPTSKASGNSSPGFPQASLKYPQPDTVLKSFLIALPQIQPGKMYYCPDFLVKMSAQGRIYAVSRIL